MDLLMIADGSPTARKRCVASPVILERPRGVYSSHHWQGTFPWIQAGSSEALRAMGPDPLEVLKAMGADP